MKRVLTAVVLVPVVLLVVFRAPWWLFALALALVIVLAIHEYLNIVRAYRIEPFAGAVYCISLLVLAGVLFATPVLHLRERSPQWLGELSLVDVLLFMIFVTGVVLIFRRDLNMALPAIACSVTGILYIAVPLAMLFEIRESPFTRELTFIVLILVWAGDTAAYYVGRSVGKHKLAPVVSPGKTWEGAIASAVVSIGVVVLAFHFWRPISWCFGYGRVGPPEGLSTFHAIALGLATNVAGQFGDLFESALKRGAQIKDSGSLLPGHGGILDRIDALLFAIPAVWYYAKLTQFLV